MIVLTPGSPLPASAPLPVSGGVGMLTDLENEASRTLPWGLGPRLLFVMRDIRGRCEIGCTELGDHTAPGDASVVLAAMLMRLPGYVSGTHLGLALFTELPYKAPGTDGEPAVARYLAAVFAGGWSVESVRLQARQTARVVLHEPGDEVLTSPGTEGLWSVLRALDAHVERTTESPSPRDPAGSRRRVERELGRRKRRPRRR